MTLEVGSKHLLVIISKSGLIKKILISLSLPVVCKHLSKINSDFLEITFSQGKFANQKMIIVRSRPEAIKRVQILAPTTCFEWFFKTLDNKLKHKFKFNSTINRFIFLRPFGDHLTSTEVRLNYFSYSLFTNCYFFYSRL